MNMIKRDTKYSFSTVGYDNQLFRDYAINQIKNDKNGVTTESQKRIIAAYDYFTRAFIAMEEPELCALLNAVANATCTTHTINNETEAIQIFIFQNDRGKRPTNLEIIKAQFIYNIHLYGNSEDEKTEWLEEIKNRFETIYHSISEIEHKLKEDDVLTYAQRIFFNSLWENNAIQKINAELKKNTRLKFIRNFTQTLSTCFEQIVSLFKKEKEDIYLHSLITVGGFDIIIPFIIKALIHKIKQKDLNQLTQALESILLRNRVIGTRAELISRLNNVYQTFNGNVAPVIGRINWMKRQNGWWGYWSDEEYKRALQGEIQHELAKILLWKYENHLIEKGKRGYMPIRYDSIIKPQLEHIAPLTENPKNGYCMYDEEFKNQYLECLGNYLLLSGYHNISIGNRPFEEKRSTYTQLHQQREVHNMTERDHFGDKEKIAYRKAKIIEFLIHN